MPAFTAGRCAAAPDLVAELTAREVAGWPVGTTFSIQGRRTITLTMILRRCSASSTTAATTALAERIHELLDLGPEPDRRLARLPAGLGGPFGRLMAMVAEMDAMLYEEIGSRRYDPSSAEPGEVASQCRCTRREAGFMSDREIRDELLTC